MKLFSRAITSISLVSMLSASSLYAADSAGISGTVKTLGDNVAQKHIDLTEGWNLVGINTALTLDELKNKLGNDNILVINGPGAVYKKGSSRSSFKNFEQGKGYHIKLSHAIGLDYTPISYANKNISLIEGWNKINPINELTLDSIKNQLGNNLAIIRGNNTKFQPNGRSNFSKFIEPYGYMIKVAHDSALQF